MPARSRRAGARTATSRGPTLAAAADAALLALEDRGSPTHDGLAARLAGYETGAGGLTIELQPMRWALRLIRDDALGALSVLCAVRSADGRWLAGRRAAWVATWAGRWALGAGGAVEVGEDPVVALTRELEEEWAVVPERLSVEALVCLSNRMTMLVGQAWLPPGAEVTRDHEHDAHAWWPADPAAWPAEADAALRRMAGAAGRMTFDQLKYLSFAHSAIYLTLLTVWIVPGLAEAERVFGWAHGIGWILMSLLCIDAVRRRVIPLWLGVTVAVIGGVGPFAGSLGFVVEERRRAGAATR